MKKFLQSLALVAILTPLFAHAEISGTATMPNGVQIPFANAAATNWVNGELVIKFTNTVDSVAKSFTLPGPAIADFLVVGGGGAGGSPGALNANRGVGGGGGAGGFVSSNEVVMAGDAYAITVGAGGLPGALGSDDPGTNGLPSVMMTSGGVDYARAFGGGGGGAESDGKDGGSGGGGSKSWTSSSVWSAHVGGSGATGQGFKGGDGVATSASALGQTAGGGGGAGGVGSNSATKNVGADGGPGKASQIWNGTDIYYAGGGGGGTATQTDASKLGHGGSGIGGTGAGGAKASPTSATPGALATGSGGGGGSFYAPGAAGGSGVVIVRIKEALKEPPVKPVSTNLFYDAQNHVFLEKSAAYTITQNGKEVDKVEGTNVGTYQALVTLKPGFTWADGTSDLADVAMTIAKANVEIIGLHMDSWAEQPAGATLPEPTCSLSIPGPTVTYTYGTTDRIEESTPVKPTKAGSYYVFATSSSSVNWNAATASSTFQIFEQPSSLFTDSVDVTIDAWKGTEPATLANYPVRLVLSENSPVGFDYTRAGATGFDICFADEAGNILSHAVDMWNPLGESVVYVRVPVIADQPQTIYLYWNVKDGKEAPSYTPERVWSDWSQQEADALANKPTGTYGIVKRDGKYVDYWETVPAVDKTSWGADKPDEVGHVTTNGWLKSGRPVTYTIYDATTEQPLDPQQMPSAEGVYYILFNTKAVSPEYEGPSDYRIDLRVIARAPYDEDKLRDGAATVTLGGRVFLANGEAMTGHEIAWNEGQAYWQVRMIDLEEPTYFNPYWTHEGDFEKKVSLPNMLDSSDHALHYINGNVTNTLWRFKDVRFGNTFNSVGTMESVKCYLPWSSTALGVSKYAQRSKVGLTNEIAHVVMRNLSSACVYSPCYTNGIGTIYFDAVNSHVDGAATGEYKIIVEMATETTDGLPPTDEFAGEELENLVWTPCTTSVLRCRDGVFDDPVETEELTLNVTEGGTNRNFYRLYVKLNRTGTCRFRIRRTASRDTAITGADTACFVLLDNIVVSFPMDDASAEPYGTYHEEKTGKEVVGWEGAMANAAFPAVGESVFARAKAITNATSATGQDPATFIQLVKFHYQWSYLNQASNGWDSVDLRMQDGLVATQPLGIPAEAGDVSFWLETYTKIPFYDYVDYSGSGLKLGGKYTEEVGTKYYPANAPEGGRCFVRLRSGASEWDGVTVVLQGAGAAGGLHAMELVGDHQWQGLVKMPTNLQGLVNFYFEGGQRWAAGAEKPYQSGVAWYPLSPMTNGLPARGETSIGGQPQPFLADGATGFMEFQFNDETGVFSLGHAEYQAFNYWNDAKRDDRLFVGSYSETSGVSVAAMMETNANMAAWETHRTTDENWNENFYLSNYESPAYPKNQAFTTHKMPHQWNGENGMFVDAVLTGTSSNDRQKNAGLAWQMQAWGVGSLSFTQTDVPVGLDTVTFSAHLAQATTFEDFSYCYADGMMATNDYTFLIPAILSTGSSDGKTNPDFATGASMSIVGYYQPYVGCYEFRIAREDNANLRFSIYKWKRQGYKMVGTQIGSHLFSGATFWHANGASAAKLYGMFISLGEDEAGKTTILGGLTTAAQAPNDGYAGSSRNYRAIRVVDDDAPLKFGTIGALSSSCKGQFLTARRYSGHLPASTIDTYKKTPSAADQAKWPKLASYYDSNTVIGSFPGTRDETADLNAMENSWACTPGRVETFMDTSYGWGTTPCGLRPPANLGQTVDVYLKTADSRSTSSEDAAWKLFKSEPVTSYGWATYSVTIRTNESCHVMLKTGDAPADVAIGAKPSGSSTSGGVTQTGWNGTDMVNPPDRDFIYTQAKVTTNMVKTVETDGRKVAVTNRYCTLQPARATPAKPLSIRGPVLDHGVGMIGFTYVINGTADKSLHLDEHAEIWVQMSTNQVTRNLTGTYGLNQSIREGSGPGEWETLRKYTYADLVAGNGELQFYIGEHDRIGNQVQGVLRIVVPTNVVSAASAETRADQKNGPKYGSITITGVMVRDEPAIDTSSWLGWNLRMIGDGTDSEKRMYLPDLNTVTPKDSGLSAALNNSTTADISGDVSEFSKVNPTIQSPTFRAGSIGAVRFRARVYDNSGVVGAPATVSLYGVKDAAGGDEGRLLQQFTVESPRYTVFEYRASQDERFSSVKLVIDGVTEGTATSARVLLDEVIVTEKLKSTIGFVYARPFRSHLSEDVAIPEAEVRGMSEQPLIDESWGVQARVKLDPYDKDIDRDSGFRVTLRTFRGESKWGYDNWKDDPAATREVNLLQVGQADDLVFRSTVSDPETIVKPVHEPNTVVQYVVTVYYRTKGDETEYKSMIEVTGVEGDGWANPTWYAPIDKNKDHPPADAVPYTILDGMSPGRAWINEVNYNDGTRAEHGDVKVETNQFIEIAVPWGVDMTGWYVNLTDMGGNTFTIAKFGKAGLPVRKMSMNRSGDYDFVVIESPKTTKAGGIRDAKDPSKKVADATWLDDSTHSSTFDGGSLQYSQPYQIELFRPSGILEHQFVMMGTNEWRLPKAYFDSFGFQYEGTNLVNELNLTHPSVKRFFAGEDMARRTKDGKVTLASFGVTGSAHGEEGGWSGDMGFTPGRVNEDQDELSGWYLRPNGGSIWVYARVAEASRGNVRQKIGDDDSQDTYVILSSGGKTNVVYDVRPWFAAEADIYGETGPTNRVLVGKGTGAVLSLNNVTATTWVVAHETIDPALIAGGLDPNDPYTPAVMKWLQAGSESGAFKHPEGPVTNAIFRGLWSGATNCVLGLKGMYCLDIDPTEGGWWLRGGMTDFKGDWYRRVRRYDDPSQDVELSDAMLKVKLYLSNDVSQVVHPPEVLRGVTYGERSDDPSTYGNWTSETFKVVGRLSDVGMTTNLPFRCFTFAPGSFAGATDPEPFVSEIEIIDPFSSLSPGSSYGWGKYRGKSAFLMWWTFDDRQLPIGVETLKAKSLYDQPPYYPVE